VLSHLDHGLWVNKLGEIAQVPYQLHNLITDLAADRTVPVFVPEGEGKADLLRTWGLIATYIAKGTKGFGEYFRDAIAIVMPDADSAGRDYVDRVAIELHGVAREVRVLALPGRPDSGDDVKDWAAAGGTADELLELSERAPPWTPRDHDPDERTQHDQEVSTAPLETFSASEFQGVEPPPRRWLVRDRVPIAAVTLLAGDGATGKTTIAMQLAAAVVGRLSGWLNGAVEEHGPVLFFTAEEDKEEVHRRLCDIVGHHGIPYPSELHVHCADGLNPQLAAITGRSRQLEPTAVYNSLRLTLDRLRPKLLILESSADLYGGDEINRTQVRLFVSYLRQLAREFDCAVILLSHPSVRGMGDDSGTSGNTAWHNSVRARMYFKTLSETEGGSHLRALEIKKNNYGPQGETMKLRWQNGVFVPEPRPNSFEREAAEKKAEELFVTLLRRVTENGRRVTNKPGTNYAPTVFADEPEAKDAKISKTAFAEAMKRLFASTKIRLDEDGPPSRRRTRLVEVPAAMDP
jgi:RecA-family ATPase